MALGKGCCGELLVSFCTLFVRFLSGRRMWKWMKGRKEVRNIGTNWKDGGNVIYGCGKSNSNVHVANIDFRTFNGRQEPTIIIVVSSFSFRNFRFMITKWLEEKWSLALRFPKNLWTKAKTFFSKEWRENRVNQHRSFHFALNTILKSWLFWVFNRTDVTAFPSSRKLQRKRGSNVRQDGSVSLCK